MDCPSRDWAQEINKNLLIPLRKRATFVKSADQTRLIDHRRNSEGQPKSIGLNFGSDIASLSRHSGPGPSINIL